MTVLSKVVHMFQSSPRRTLLKMYIYEHCWGLPWYEGCENTLRHHISKARDEVSGSIVSMREVGYVYYPKEIE